MPIVVAITLFELFSFRKWWTIRWVNEWVENGQFARFLRFNERIQLTIFETCFNKGLTEVVAIFEKVEDATLHVNHNSDDAANIEVAKWWLDVLFNWIVVSPVSASVYVTRCQVHAPEVACP